MASASVTILSVSDPQLLLWLGVVLVLCSALYSALLWLGNRLEDGLTHVLAAAVLQGLALLGHLARPWLGGPATLLNLLLLGATGYGLWALRRFAGLSTRLRRWEWFALMAWAFLALAFRTTGLGLPALLVILALAVSLLMRRLAQEGPGQTPALACEGLALLLALAAVVSGIPSSFFAALRGTEAVQARAWFCFGVLAAQQLYTFLLAQVQGQRLRVRLDSLTTVDTLTGLASAKGFKDRLDRAVGRSLRTGRITSILVLELDGFEGMVAEHGPAPIKFILEAFAGTLTQTLREADLTGRLEGCRFAALLHQTSPLEALLAAERLRTAWNNLSLPLAARVFRPTLSGGVASTQEPVANAEDLLGLALGRMASVRLGGGNNMEGEPQPN